jgi:hypothetical protein
MDKKRHVQATADGAAIAAAKQLMADYVKNQGLDPSGAAKKAAQNLAAANSLTHDGKITKVTVNIPPLSGAFKGQKSFAEVEIETQIPATFGAAVTGKPLTIKSRAVALGRPARLGIIVLRPSGADALVIKSLVGVAILNGDIIVNSSDAAAFNNQSVGLIQAKNIDITGNWVNSGGAVIGKVRTGVAPSPDPLRYLPVPDPSALVVRSPNKLVVNSLLPTILQPGIYRGGIEIKGLSIVTMLPGIYYIEGGGLQITGLATVLGLDTFIYNTGGAVPAGPITITAKAVLAAPLAGVYRGIGIFQDRAVNQPISITGSGLTAITGLIYAPAAPVQVSGLLGIGVDILGGSYICNTLSIDGTANIQIDLGLNRPQIPEITLVE